MWPVTATQADMPAASADELVLEDGGSAKVAVQLASARWRITRRHEMISSPEEPSIMVVTYLAQRGVKVDGAVRAWVEWRREPDTRRLVHAARWRFARAEAKPRLPA